MTSREAYLLGWVFGFIRAESGDRNFSGDVGLASMRPLSSMARAIAEANRAGFLKGEADKMVMEALDQVEIDSMPEETVGGEPVMPMQMRNSWDLGFYDGKDRKPFRV